KAQANIDTEKALELEKKLRTQQFTFDDFLDQLQQLKKMGPLSDIIGMIPGLNPGKLGGMELDDRQLVKTEAIIQSMTREERYSPSILNAGRRKRIAKGSGTSIQDVNKLIKSFGEFRKMMKRMSGMEKSMKRGRIKFPF
ncbi:MAG: signal recognition particle protein, partial [Clostridiales bacterium]|nr:signal recognition particle protein [Clostridiales bacterium]